MTAHDQFAEDLALYALNTLTGADKAALEAHLAGCAECRRELEQLHTDISLLALSTEGPAPPARSRQRLLSAIAQEKPAAERESRRSSAWGWFWVPSLAAVAMALVAFSLWRQSQDLNRRIKNLEAQNSQVQSEVQHAREVANLLTSPEAKRFTLIAANARPQPQAKAVYMASTGKLVLLASNMEPPPAGKAYEVWLLPMSGAAPMPCGMFKPDSKGSATMMGPGMPYGTEAKGFAITMENEAGSEVPTPPILMVGTG
ncbi:MAG TPA: anti-sigma factor [Terriglobales bacterium]|nr:anti-sigma factor [Terriglobales bacterium]